MVRVLILGSNGQLGRELGRRLAGQEKMKVVSLGRQELDLSDAGAVGEAVRESKPQILINAAAYTAVDRAEQEVELANRVNGVAPGVMAEEMRKLGGWLIHYSTDYVFDGTGSEPWREDDMTGPLSVYGESKLAGERAIAAEGCRHLIFRTSWVFAETGKNFLHTMLRLGRERAELKVVDDQIGAPTTAEALAAATVAVVGRVSGLSASDDHLSGVYHLVCGGETSWCGFARAIFEEFSDRQKAPVVTGIPTEAYPTPARRPRNSRLSGQKFRETFGFGMPTWETALAEVAAAMKSR